MLIYNELSLKFYLTFRRLMKHNTPTVRVSVIILDSAKKKILLVKHKKPTRSYWVLPGGHLDYGETMETCAVRELKEETNLDIEVDKMLYVSEAIAPDSSRHILNVYYLAHVTGGEIRLGDEDVLAGVDYIDISELKNIVIYPNIVPELLESIKNNFNHPIQYLGNRWD